jgi:hypothetical protein
MKKSDPKSLKRLISDLPLFRQHQIDKANIPDALPALPACPECRSFDVDMYAIETRIQHGYRAVRESWRCNTCAAQWIIELPPISTEDDNSPDSDAYYET